MNLDWLEEKAENVVKNICHGITSSEKAPSELRVALSDALKVLLNIHEQRTGKMDLWSPGVVKAFSDAPDQCDALLELVYEPGFMNDYYKK